MSELAWSTGFTTIVHNCPTSSEHYKSMMGQTINKITYYTSKGIYEVDADVYVPVKFTNEFSVENASVTAGNTSVKLEGLPDDSGTKTRIGYRSIDAGKIRDKQERKRIQKIQRAISLEDERDEEQIGDLFAAAMWGD